MYTNISFILWSLHSCLTMAAKNDVIVFFFEDLEGSATETTNLTLKKCGPQSWFSPQQIAEARRQQLEQICASD